MISRLLAALGLLLVGCGAPPTIVAGGNTINGGLVTITAPGTYSYTLVATTGGCSNADSVTLQLVVR